VNRGKYRTALLLDGQLGPISFAFRRASAVIVLLFVAGSCLPRGWLALYRWASDRRSLAKGAPSQKHSSGLVKEPEDPQGDEVGRRPGDRIGWNPSIVGWLPFAAALAIVARAPSVSVALVAFVFGLAAIAGATRGTFSRTSSTLLPALAAYFAIRFAIELVPQAGALAEGIARAACRSGEHITLSRGKPLSLNPTAIGLPSVLLAVLLLLSSALRNGSRASWLAALAIPAVWLAVVPLASLDASPGPVAAFNRGAIHGLAWLGIASIVAVVGRREAAQRDPHPGLPRGAIVAVLSAAFCGVCLVGTAFLGAPARRSIRVYNRGGLDWDRPVFGRFGAFSGGMFGLWPVYSRAEGYEFTVFGDPNGEIRPSDLEGTQILVLINLPKTWEALERRTVYDFVASGGSLLVLGDHTDVFGLMRGFNTLLEPAGIQFRFDSAYKARETWRGCESAATDAVAWGWELDDPGVAVGASLDLIGSARPLLIGRYGFSDAGMRENVSGSFLGNYHYDPGERLGDVVLLATAVHGRGRIVVWGDTTAFQGVSSFYPRVVGPMLAWLSRPAAWTEQPGVRAVAAAGLLASVVWLWIVRRGVGASAAIAFGLLFGLAVPWCMGITQREARVTVAQDTLLIDRSHFPASGHYEARVNPVGPLYTNALRSGFRVAELEHWDGQAIARARAAAFIAPQKTFSRSEVNDLLNAEKAGTVLILAASQPDSSGARALLDAHGLALLPRPLGTVTSADLSASRRERETHPRFLEAWPIVASDGGDPARLPGVDIIYRHGPDVVALFRRTGKGGLLLISDTRFFSDMNVEDVSGSWIGNLALIHDLFERYLGADPDAVQPLFESPVKPQ
jgi:hypothetical protein